MGAAGIIQGIGSGVSAYGAYTEGQAQSRYFKYLASNSRTEAALATQEGQQQSTFAQDQGLEETKQLNRQVSETEGSQIAGAGANVGGGSVTTADIASDTFNKAKLDAMAIKYNANLKSWNATEGAKLRSWQLGREAGGYDVAAGAAKTGGKIGAFNSLLGGAGQISSTWLKGSPYRSTTGNY